MNGAIGATPGALYVWGVNRGAGTARLNALGTPALDPDVRWDALAVQLTDGTLRIVQFPAAGAPVITAIAGGAVINGNTISTSVPLSFWPTRGFDPTSYTFQLWSRLRVNPAADGFNSEIADFGPRIFASVPEPASWALMIAGFGLMGATVRRRTAVRYA
ncbi:MAG: PEP-CTERM sorting domain-containing protein [Proteobacteria bacterium]|nr:PEP-CTERM sorting domain-containing protein [Pseudomonadota bacterium]